MGLKLGVSLRGRNSLKVFENRPLRWIFGPVGGGGIDMGLEVTDGIM